MRPPSHFKSEKDRRFVRGGGKDVFFQPKCGRQHKTPPKKKRKLCVDLVEILHQPPALKVAEKKGGEGDSYLI